MITPVARSTFVSRLVCVLLSFVGGRLCGACCGPPTAFPVGHRCTVGVLAGTTESRVTLWQSANPSLCGCWCCWSRDIIVFLAFNVCRGTGCSSCATENTYTPARLEALFTVVTILSHSYHFHQIFCGLWVLSPTRHLVRDLIEMFLLAACSVAIHLVHVNANLFLSRKTDQFRMLSRLSLDITTIFATGYTLYFVSAAL